MVALKPDINQQEFCIVDLHFAKPLEVVNRVSETQLQVSENTNSFINLNLVSLIEINENQLNYKVATKSVTVMSRG